MAACSKKSMALHNYCGKRIRTYQSVPECLRLQERKANGRRQGLSASLDGNASGARTFRSIFKWGAPDRFKHPNARLFAMLKDKLEMTDADFTERNG